MPRPDPLALGDHAADGDALSVLLGRKVGERAVDLRAQRRPHLLERVARQEQAERLLLPLVQLLAVVRQRHDRWVAMRRRVLGPTAVEVEERRLAAPRVLLRLLTGGLRARQRVHHPGARARQ
jgi:hypothetical protein